MTYTTDKALASALVVVVGAAFFWNVNRLPLAEPSLGAATTLQNIYDASQSGTSDVARLFPDETYVEEFDRWLQNPKRIVAVVVDAIGDPISPRTEYVCIPFEFSEPGSGYCYDQRGKTVSFPADRAHYARERN